MFILDTDHISIVQRQTEPEFTRLAVRMLRFRQTDFYYTIISFHEEAMGWNAYLSRARSQVDVVHGYGRLTGMLRDFAAMNVFSFEPDAAQEFERLRGLRVRIGSMDLRIAAIALSRKMTVLTRNLADFALVPGLQVEDWTL